MTGFILAGGQSSRMGRDKALLPIGDTTLIELVIQRLRPWVDRLVVIGNTRNMAQLRALPIDEALLDVKPDCGPLMGVFTGLMHTQTAVNAFISCDMPFIDGRLIERLAGACHGEAPVVASVHPEEGIQPFPLVCHVKAGRVVGALLNRGQWSLRGLLSQPQASVIRIEQPELWRSFTNVNTLADYARVCEGLATPLSSSVVPGSREQRPGCDR